jgi:drug/metabolite transporter (DMT)-like permease
MPAAVPEIEGSGGGAEVEPRRQAAGVALVLCAAVAFGLVPNFARLAYDGGIDVLTLVTARGVVLVLALFAILRLMSLPVRLDRRTLRLCLAMGFTMAGASFGYLGAVQYIPVNFAVLIFFTFPLMVNVISHFTANEPLTPARLAALAVALCGLAVALGVSFERLDPRGLALAAFAAVCVAFQVCGVAHAVRSARPVVVTFHMMLSASAILIVVLVLAGGPTWPVTPDGWFASAGAVVSFLIALLTFYSGVPRIGPGRAALFVNLEPLVTIAAAYVLLGEALGPVQLVGAAMVLGAVFAGHLIGRTSREPVADSN